MTLCKPAHQVSEFSAWAGMARSAGEVGGRTPLLGHGRGRMSSFGGEVEIDRPPLSTLRAADGEVVQPGGRETPSFSWRTLQGGGGNKSPRAGQPLRRGIWVGPTGSIAKSQLIKLTSVKLTQTFSCGSRCCWRGLRSWHTDGHTEGCDASVSVLEGRAWGIARLGSVSAQGPRAYMGLSRVGDKSHLPQRRLSPAVPPD